MHTERNDYVKIPIDLECAREVMSEIDTEHLKKLKYEMTLTFENFNDAFNFVNEYGIKLHSLIVSNLHSYSDEIIEEIKNHPLESIYIDAIRFSTRKKYYNFMKYLHSMKTLENMSIDYVNIAERVNYQEVYEQIDRSFIKKIHMKSYYEFVIESVNSSLEILSIDKTIFHYCDISLYINEVKKLIIYVENFDYVSLEIEGIITERLERLFNKVKNVEYFGYRSYDNIKDQVFFNFLINNHKNLKRVNIENKEMIDYMIRCPIMNNTVLDELYLQIYDYEMLEELHKNIVVRNIYFRNEHIPDASVKKFLNGGIKPLILKSTVDLNDFTGIENIKMIQFTNYTRDCYFEILKKPENNIREIKISFSQEVDNFRKLIESFESEHCKVNIITIDNKFTIETLLEILRPLHKKLMTLSLTLTLYEDCDMTALVNYILESNIKNLYIRMHPFRITTENLAKLIIKTKKIIVYGIDFIDDGGVVPNINNLIYTIKDKRILNEEYYLAFKNHLEIQNHSKEKITLYGPNKYSFKFRIMTIMSTTKYFVGEIHSRIENGENVEIKEELIKSIMDLPSNVIGMVVNRL